MTGAVPFATPSELTAVEPTDAGIDIALDPRQAPAEHYRHLSERAVQFVRDHSGAVSEEALVAFVFGSTGSSALWQPLLRSMLASEDRLFLRPDGRWALAGMPPPSTASGLTEFVAIDVETTGLRPVQQRVIEVALIRFRDGQEVERFSTLVNPGKRIPKFITKLTGISDEMVAAAPPFADVANRVTEFIDGALLVGHNVSFDINFLTAEMQRAGLPGLINARIDVMGLAARLLPSLRRPSLDRVVAELGIAPRKIHRAEGDAELAAIAAMILAVKAADLGIDSIERLTGIGRPTDRLPVRDVGRARAILDRALLADIPKLPGVYLMQDANDRIIYIGKAKNLRERVSSYFSQPLGYTRKMDGLIESIARIEVEITGSELTALLLESQLIRRYQPRYNVAMRTSEEYPFIRIDIANPWPRVTLAKARREDGAAYFGPFKSRKAARSAVELINHHYPLRTCPRTFKTPRSYGSPCIQLDLGRCLGPCVGRANRDDYMAHVRQVMRFLDGDDEILFTRLWESLEESARDLDFERARRLRNDLNVLRGVVGANRRLREAHDRMTLLLILPAPASSAIEVHLVVQGRLWATMLAHRESEAGELAGRLDRCWQRYRAMRLPPLDHDSLDDAVILQRWLVKAAGHPALIAFAPDGTIDWEVLAAQALSLDQTVLQSIGVVTGPLASGGDQDVAPTIVEEGTEEDAPLIPSLRISAADDPAMHAS